VMFGRKRNTGEDQTEANEDIPYPSFTSVSRLARSASHFRRHGCCVRLDLEKLWGRVPSQACRQAKTRPLNQQEVEVTAMAMITSVAAAQRIQRLRQILNHERTVALERVRDIREDQDQDISPPPGDELDVARSLADVEMHASLIEQAEFRLKSIDGALSRLEEGRYGICEDCGEEIPIERLQAVPFTTCCVGCQQARNRRRRPGEGTVDEPSRHLWTLPEEMDESLERQDSLTEPEEAIIVHDQEPLGPELGEFQQLIPVATARRRGRLKKTEPRED
jgi:RNA polymerase-binding protein DksA